MPTFVWKNNIDGDWDTVSDWTPVGPPTSGSSVTVNTASLHTVTYTTDTLSIASLSVGNDIFDMTGGMLTIAGSASFGNLLEVQGGTLEFGTVSASAGSLEQDGGVIDGTGTLTVNGAATITGGAETGPGTTLLKGTTTVSGNGLGLDGRRILENQGTLNLTGGGFSLGSAVGNGTIKNDAGATFDIQSDQAIDGNLGADTFTNAGMLTKSITTGTTYIDVTFTNTGTVSVQTGTLEFAGGGSSAASAFTVASGAKLNFNAGTFDLGAGTIAGTGLTELTYGTLELGANSVTVASFEQDYGTVDGTGTLTVIGPAAFTRGTETGTGTTVLKGTTTMSGVPGVSLSLSQGRTLENRGMLNWTGAYFSLVSPIHAGAYSETIKNDAGATFDIQTDNYITSDTGTNTFTNAGTLKKTVTTGTTNIQVALANTGMVSVQTGTLEFDGGGTSVASAFAVASGATLDFGGYQTFTMTGGTYSVVGVTQVSGIADFSAATIASFGSKLLVTRGTLELGTQAATAASFEQDGGTIDGTGTLTVTGAATLGGLQQGTGRTLLKGTTTVAGNPYLDGGRILENQGMLSWTGGFLPTFYLGENPYGTSAGNATIKNDSGATFAIKSDGSIVGYIGTNTFTNAGTLTKSVTTGTTNIGVAFTNTGTVSVQTGVLEFDAGGTSSASAFRVASGATLDFGGSNVTFTMTGGTYNVAGVTQISNGTADFSAATLTSFGSELLVTGGTLELGSKSTSVGSLEQDNGTIDGTGTLTVNGAATFTSLLGLESGTGTTLLKGTTTASGGLALDSGRILENQGTLNWTGGGFALGYMPFSTRVGSGTIKNDSGATFAIKSDGSIVGYAGTSTFTNAGTLTKSLTTGTTNIGVAFTNTGTVSVQTGTLEFDGGGTSSASAFTVASGATLMFSRAPYSLDSNNFTITGGIYNVAGTTQVSDYGGTVDFSAATLTSFGSELLVAGGMLELGSRAFSA